MAVTKNVEIDKIQEAIDAGITDIGENRVQELEKKYEAFGNKINYHMIGHLQTNKVKYIIDKVKLIHSLDRMSLVKEINRRANQHNLIMDTLVQVNISGEETKYGLPPEEVMDFIEEVEKYENINIKGLMTMAPHVEDVEKTRVVFKKLAKLAKEIEKKDFKQTDMGILSMGMTNDYRIALQEGSNIIRVGRAIFGEREY